MKHILRFILILAVAIVGIKFGAFIRMCVMWFINRTPLSVDDYLLAVALSIVVCVFVWQIEDKD